MYSWIRLAQIEWELVFNKELISKWFVQYKNILEEILLWVNPYKMRKKSINSQKNSLFICIPLNGNTLYRSESALMLKMMKTNSRITLFWNLLIIVINGKINIINGPFLFSLSCVSLVNHVKYCKLNLSTARIYIYLYKSEGSAVFTAVIKLSCIFLLS